MSNLYEQETTVTMNRLDDTVQIFTANPSHLRRLRSEARAVLLEDFGDSARFGVKVSDYDPMRGFKTKRKPLTEEQRAAAAERLRKGRETLSNSDSED